MLKRMRGSDVGAADLAIVDSYAIAECTSQPDRDIAAPSTR